MSLNFNFFFSLLHGPPHQYHIYSRGAVLEWVGNHLILATTYLDQASTDFLAEMHTTFSFSPPIPPFIYPCCWCDDVDGDSSYPAYSSPPMLNKYKVTTWFLLMLLSYYFGFTISMLYSCERDETLAETSSDLFLARFNFLRKPRTSRNTFCPPLCSSYCEPA
jgi:hypothetical protein